MRKTLLSGAICVSLLFSCTKIPTDTGELSTKIYRDNMEYCWTALSIFSIFQSKVPQSVDGFFSAKDLYKTVNDKWTVYYNADTAKLFLSFLTTSMAGVGIMPDSVENGIFLKQVFPNSPGWRAGLRAKDTIVAINGGNLAEVSYGARLKLLSGKIGDIRRLTVHRGSQELSIIVTLGVFMAPSVVTDSLDSLTAYIGISEFSDSTIMKGGTSAEFDSAISQTRWARYTILDLRENGGGFIDEALDVAGQFVPMGSAIATVHERIWDSLMAPYGMTMDSVWATTRNDGMAINRKTYVLVDSFTASASEIVLLGLHEFRSADIVSVGTYTYGKARGQYVFFPTPANGLAKITFSLLTPKLGPGYDGIGIKPNQVIAAGEDALTVARNLIRQKEGLSPAAKARQSDAYAAERIRRLRNQMSKPFFEPLGIIKVGMH